MTYRRLTQTVFATSFIVFGCGGGGGDGTSDSTSCELVPACGGAVEGAWKVVDFCPDTSTVPEAITQLCESASLDVGEIAVSGTLSFGADQSFTQTSTAKGTGYIVFDAACLKQGDISLTCGQLEEAINDQSGPTLSLARVVMTVADARWPSTSRSKTRARTPRRGHR